MMRTCALSWVMCHKSGTHHVSQISNFADFKDLENGFIESWSRALNMILILIFCNRRMAGTAALAYSLGLRHALDADHIAVSPIMPVFESEVSLLRANPGNRSHDPSPDSRWATTYNSRDVLLAWTLYVCVPIPTLLSPLSC